MTITHPTVFSLAACGLGLFLPAAAFASPHFDDVPPSTTYASGASDVSNGVKYFFSDYEVSPGVLTNVGKGEIFNLGVCGAMHELKLREIFVEYDYAGSGSAAVNPSILLEWHGGPINLSVNGQRLWAPGPGGIPATVGGCGVTFVPLGSGCGRIDLNGTVHRFGFGGVDVFLDASGQFTPPCDWGYEDLPPSFVKLSGSGFTTGGLPSKVLPLQLSSGSLYHGGHVSISHSQRACQSGQELELRSACVFHDILATGAAYDNVEWAYGYQGGIVNFEINGQPIQASHITGLHGAVLGGCRVYVIPTGGICGKIKVTGIVDTIAIGGQELFVDCLLGDPVLPPIPGDVDGDGDVDINDLMALLAAYGSSCGSCPEDIDGDGDVDIDDLMILLSNYGT